MKRAITCGMFLLLAPIGATAQTQNARPTFDVATIKLDACGGPKSNRASADELISADQTLKQLVVLAYSVQSYQVTGPGWLESVCFDVAGKYPPDTKYRDRWLMLRTLLEDRFHLAVHHETKEMQGYALMVAKSGFKLKPSDPGEGSTSGGNQGRVWTFRARKIPMSDLAYELADSLGGVVVDMTSLDGVYDFQLRWASDDMSSPGASDVNPAPSIFTALEDTLGLALQRQKVPVDTIVVDHVDRAPTEN
ncbi:MAG: TIGR03435 family protein [Acidobacteriaceae bacterium]|jgi:uncharacterized protein (TIGR03435 family)